MKKLRNRVIVMLVIISAVSSGLSSLLAMPLIAEFLTETEPWVTELVRNALQNSLSLFIFTLFVILGVREITQPVLVLAENARRIAEGDYSVDIPETKRKDEIGQLEKRFAVMVKELRSIEYMQKDFATNVSHEFKTPLSVIMGYARFLADDTLTPAERVQYSEFIEDEVGRLSAMTSNTLLLSRLENKGTQPVRAPYALDEQLRQVTLLHITTMQAKDLALTLDAPAIVIDANEDMLVHVWSNLLENAIKFSDPGGSITIHAAVEDGFVTVSFTDTGIGIDAETAEHIFDHFYQGDTSRRDSGNGLGLALVRRIVELHGGSLHVNSEPEHGSVFSVMLPLRSGQATT